MKTIIKEVIGTITVHHCYDYHLADGIVNKDNKATVERVAVIDKKTSCLFTDNFTKVDYADVDSLHLVRRNAFEATRAIGLFNSNPNNPFTKVLIKKKWNEWVLLSYDRCSRKVVETKVTEKNVTYFKANLRWKYLAVAIQSEERHKNANLFSITDHLLRR